MNTPTATPGPDLSAAHRALLERRLEAARQAVAPRPPGTSSRPPLEPRPLSCAQERLWFLDQLNPGQPDYVMFQAVRLAGPLDRAALARALAEIVRRHAVFRTDFANAGDGPVQTIREWPPDEPFPLPLVALPAGAGPDDLERVLRAEARRPFDLSGDLLLRGLLVSTGPDRHVLLLTMHHIVSDGWSLGVLFRELARLYDDCAAGRPPSLPPLPLHYTDYAARERAEAAASGWEQALGYWRDRLAGDRPPLELPADHPRPALPSTRGATQSLALPAPLAASLRTVGQRSDATLFMTLLAAFQVLLHRYTGQTDIAIGSCVAGRLRPELEPLIGLFVNTLVFRLDLAGGLTFRELLGRVREAALGAFAHQELPFERLVQELRPERTPGRNPFFQVMFVLQSATGPLPQPAGLGLEPLELANGTAKFDLTLSVTETPQGLLAALEYRTDLFEADTIRRMLGHYRTLLEGIVADDGTALARLPLLTAAERQRILGEWSGRRTDYPRDATIGRLFREQAARTPAAVAVNDATARLTYRQLEERADQIAHLLHRLGAPPGSLVAVCHERACDLIAALLGILQAGCAYVALDPAHPVERLATLVADAAAPVLLTQERLRPVVDAALARAAGAGRPRPHVVCLDAGPAHPPPEDTRPPPDRAGPEDLAYVSYTSGSTGQPKGVCVPHRGVVRLVRGADYASFGPDETLLQAAPVGFDASTLEIWGALLNGGRVALLPPGPATLGELGRFIREQHVTTLWLTAGLFHQMVEHQLDSLAGVRQLLAGGDVLSVSHVARAAARLPHTRLINGYGPTENTTFTCCHAVTRPVAPDRSIPIGRPIANTQVYLLDAALEPVPVGVPGELYTGGDGLARGYLNQPALTRERFVPHPFAPPGERLYRTGDRARWRPDGTIEFLGRSDRQVKIRGFRVEPEEIETALELHPAVAQAAVVARGHDAVRTLVAYLVAAREPAPAPAELRQHLQQKLPEYLVPSAFITLAALPLTANGKVDRDALPAPDRSPAARAGGAEPPQSETERRLAALWARVLDLPRVGRRENFFELGGHSLAGVRLFAQIEQEFGRRLPLAALFQAPTVAELAQRLQQAGSAGGTSSLVALQPRGTLTPVFFVHGAGGGNLWTYANLVPHLDPAQPVYALESRAMRGLEEFGRIEDLAAHYVEEIRTVQPRGPYLLAGYCFGGNVAYEIARQFEALGETVALLALLDSAPANGVYHRIPWWNPVFLVRFAVNTGWWLRDFLGQPPADRRRFLARKFATWTRKARRLLARRRAAGDDIDLDEVIDVSLFPEIEIQLWKTHLRALWAYRPGPYRGRVTLFRTRGQPFLCSFDPRFGWGELVAGGVEVVNLPGAHEKIFLEPHLRVLSARLGDCLARAQATLHPAGPPPARP